MRTRQRIRLHLDTGRSIDGILLAKRGDMYELGDVRLELDGKLQPIDERVFVPKHRVEFAQRGSAS